MGNLSTRVFRQFSSMRPGMFFSLVSSSSTTSNERGGSAFLGEFPGVAVIFRFRPSRDDDHFARIAGVPLDEISMYPDEGERLVPMLGVWYVVRIHKERRLSRVIAGAGVKQQIRALLHPPIVIDAEWRGAMQQHSRLARGFIDDIARDAAAAAARLSAYVPPPDVPPPDVPADVPPPDGADGPRGVPLPVAAAESPTAAQREYGEQHAADQARVPLADLSFLGGQHSEDQRVLSLAHLSFQGSGILDRDRRPGAPRRSPSTRADEVIKRADSLSPCSRQGSYPSTHQSSLLPRGWRPVASRLSPYQPQLSGPEDGLPAITWSATSSQVGGLSVGRAAAGRGQRPLSPQVAPRARKMKRELIMAGGTGNERDTPLLSVRADGGSGAAVEGTGAVSPRRRQRRYEVQG